MILVLALLLTAAVIVFTLFVRPQDLPAPEPVSPVAHLDERKARIYENLRDLQFEYRLGKLSDEDYQRTKLGLQAELASTLAEIDRVLGKAPAAASPAAGASPAAAAPPAAAASPAAAVPATAAAPVMREAAGAASKGAGLPAHDPLECPHCGARFEKPMKFCGMCGKPMTEVDA
jgi:hypothetical protein